MIARTNLRPPTAAECASCPHHHVDVLGATPEAERARLRAFFRLRRYEPRETVYAQGDSGTQVAVIREGLVKLVLYSPVGTERIVRLAMPGDTIGLELMLGGRFQHGAKAVTHVELCLMPLEAVDERFTHDPAFARKVIAEWHASADEAERFLTDLSTGPAQARIARLLIHLATRLGAPGCPAIPREDMGALLGITTETASRIVAELKRDGLLRETAGGRWGLEIASLRKLAATLR